MRDAQQGKFEVFRADRYRIAIVVARFNQAITDALLESALAVLTRYQIKPRDIQICPVAGAAEIPVILNRLAKTGRYDALVALGAIIRGETPHFEYVAKIATEGVLKVMLDNNIPVGLGILTTNNLKQARARLTAGGEAVTAALQNARLIKEMEQPGR